MTAPIRGPLEASLEELIPEAEFERLLAAEAQPFFRLANTLVARRDRWKKAHFAKLVGETDALESFLDDYGARYNRRFADFTELVASLRWFANAGHSIAHLLGRLPGYSVENGPDGPDAPDGWDLTRAVDAIEEGAAFLVDAARALLEEVLVEARRSGLSPTAEAFPEDGFDGSATLLKLPRNVGQEELENEGQKIAEVASKFLQAAEMIARTEVREIRDPGERHTFLTRMCTEEKARVYEATVHNLQSTYDTHVRNTVLEGQDDRLPRLRGSASVALHLLQAVTRMAHFLERHEDDARPLHSQGRVFELVDRAEVERVTINIFLLWAHRLLQRGTRLAEDLLPEYTNVQELEVELPDGVELHARPAALIVGIVNHHGTPVEMEVDGQSCSAESILKILVAIGSKPDARRFVFRGDERPLRDIHRLFLAGLGDQGMEQLPEQLDYLRRR